MPIRLQPHLVREAPETQPLPGVLTPPQRPAAVAAAGQALPATSAELQHRAPGQASPRGCVAAPPGQRGGAGAAASRLESVDMPAVAALECLLRQVDPFAERLGPVDLLRLSSTCQALRQAALTPTVIRAATGLPLAAHAARDALAAALRRQAAIDLGRLRQTGAPQTLRITKDPRRLIGLAVSPLAGHLAVLSDDLRPTILRADRVPCAPCQLPPLPERAHQIEPSLLWSSRFDVLLVGIGNQLLCAAFGAAGDLQWQASCSNPDGCRAEQQREISYCFGVNNTFFGWGAGGTCLAQRLSDDLSIWHLDMLRHRLEAVPFTAAAGASRPRLDHVWAQVFSRDDRSLMVAHTPAGAQRCPPLGIRLTSHRFSAGAGTGPLWKASDAVDFPAGWGVDFLHFDGEERHLYGTRRAPSMSLIVAHLHQDGTRFCGLTLWQEELRSESTWAELTLAVRPVGTQVVVAATHRVYLFCAGRLQQPLVEVGDRTQNGSAPVWSKDGRLLLAAGADRIHLWEFGAGRGGPDKHQTIPLPSGLFSLSPNGQTLGVAIEHVTRGPRDCRFEYVAYDLRRHGLLAQWSNPDHRHNFPGEMTWNCAQGALCFRNFTPDEIYLVSTLRKTSSMEACQLQPPLPDGDYSLRHALQWSASGSHLWVATRDGSAPTWQLRTYSTDLGSSDSDSV